MNYCIDCHKPITYRATRCKSCMRIPYKGKNAPNYIDGRSKDKEYLKKRKNTYQIKYVAERRKTDVTYKLLYSLRSRITRALKNTIRLGYARDLLGCSLDFWKLYLEQQFKPGMSWDNYGAWHIDHIKPLASFDFSQPEAQLKCFHYTNTQPLWAKENMSKGNKYDTQIA